MTTTAQSFPLEVPVQKPAVGVTVPGALESTAIIVDGHNPQGQVRTMSGNTMDLGQGIGQDGLPILAPEVEEIDYGAKADEYEQFSAIARGYSAIKNKFFWLNWRASPIDDTLPRMIVFTVWAAIVCIVYFVAKLDWSMNGTIIVTVMGFVISLLIVFRTNTAYERWMEGRRLWSAMHSMVRNLGRVFRISCPQDNDFEYAMKLAALRLLVAFPYSVKHHLRNENPLEHPDMQGLIPTLKGTGKLATSGATGKFFFEKVDRDLKQARAKGTKKEPLTGFQRPTSWDDPWIGNVPIQINEMLHRYVSWVKHLEKLHALTISGMGAQVSAQMDILSNLERILTTPMPLAYAIHLRQILLVYLLALPFQLLRLVGWWTIVVQFVCTWALCGLENVGQEIENPFGWDENDLPLDQFCRQMRREVDFMTENPSAKADEWDIYLIDQKSGKAYRPVDPHGHDAHAADAHGHAAPADAHGHAAPAVDDLK